MSMASRTSTRSMVSTRSRSRLNLKFSRGTFHPERCATFWSGQRFTSRNCWTTGNWLGRGNRSIELLHWSDAMGYHVIEARYVGGYVVWLRFRDGTAGEIDLAQGLRGPVFEPLRDPGYFKAFMVH